VRGRGYIKSIEDIENIVLKVENGTPVYVKNIGNVHLGGDIGAASPSSTAKAKSSAASS
jgi:Cu/Ag efflux pump CusA